MPDRRKRFDGTMDAAREPFQLLIHTAAPGAYVRFVIMRLTEHGQHPGALLQSGTRDGPAAVIHGVETAARRLMAGVAPDAFARP